MTRSVCVHCSAPLAARAWRHDETSCVEVFECGRVVLAVGLSLEVVQPCPSEPPPRLREDEAHLLVPILTDQAVRDRLAEAEQEIARLRAEAERASLEADVRCGSLLEAIEAADRAIEAIVR